MIQIPLEIGDLILGGRFKNKKITVKEIGYDEYGNPTINGRSILKIRIPKLYQQQENDMNINENVQLLDGTKEGAQQAISVIEAGLQNQVPYIEVTSGLIGRWDYLHIRVIFERKENWKHNIKQNAAQFVMTLTSNGTLQESHRHLYIPSKRPFYALDSLPIKFRKTKVKNLQDVVSKISKYIQDVKKSFASEGHPLKEYILEAAVPFQKSPIEVKIKKDSMGRWNATLQTVNGEADELFAVGYETKEQAEHAAMMYGYSFAGNPYSPKTESSLKSLVRNIVERELRIQRRRSLHEVAVIDDAEIEEYAWLADQIDKYEAEIAKLKKRFGELDDKFRKMLEALSGELGDNKETFIRYKKILIKIKKRGYERTNYKYKEAFDWLYERVSPQMKKLITETLEAHKTITTVKSSLSVQYEAGNWFKNMFTKFKNWFSTFITKMRITRSKADSAMDKLETMI